jgi:hypothetical protein
MKNITIAVSEEVARWARVYAAEHETSISRMLGDTLREKMAADSSYARSMDRFLSKHPVNLRDRGERYPGRDDVHER